MKNNTKFCFLNVLLHSCPYVQSILRGCLTKNHPLNLAQKIILPETLATERLYQGWNKNRFVLIRNDFIVALGAI